MRQASRQLAATGRPYRLPLHSTKANCNDAFATLDIQSSGDIRDVDGCESDNGRVSTDKEGFSAKFRETLFPVDRLEAWKTDREIERKRIICCTETVQDILILVKLGRAESEYGLGAAYPADPRFADCSGAEQQIQLWNF